MDSKELNPLDWLDNSTDDVIQSSEKADKHTRKAYDKKLVAWLDILGIRNKIKDEEHYDAESIFDIMTSLSQYVTTACEDYVADGSIDYLQIADGFMIVANSSLSEELCAILAEIQWKILINLKMLSRGAITAGNVSVHNNDRLIIGPAYVDAYVLESENAIFPRVIISESFFEAGAEEKLPSHIAIDNDKIKYIDFINYIMKKQNHTKETFCKIMKEKGIYAVVENMCYANNTNISFAIQQKYGWLVSLLEKNNIEINDIK